MGKLMVFGLSLVLVFLIVSVASAIVINEVELNPEGNDDGNEWIELYSENEINLTGWKILNKDDDEINLNETFQDYLVIEISSQWLDNINESVRLYNDAELIDETIVLEDNADDNRTWQYCNEWNFIDSTKDSSNSCEIGDNGDANGDNDDEDEEDIYLRAEWDEDDIVNGEEFDIDVEAFNLRDDDYNIRVYITREDDETVISDRYDEEEEEWKSGRYYVDNFFSGPGNKSQEITLRIRTAYRDFDDDAILNIRIEGEDYLLEKDIEVLEEEKDETSNNEDEGEEEEEEIREPTITGGVIRLGNRNEGNEVQETQVQEDVEEESIILYESGTEKIKKYAIYALNAILIVIIIFLVRERKTKGFKKRKKLKNKRKKK